MGILTIATQIHLNQAGCSTWIPNLFQSGQLYPFPAIYTYNVTKIDGTIILSHIRIIYPFTPNQSHVPQVGDIPKWSAPWSCAQKKSNIHPLISQWLPHWCPFTSPWISGFPHIFKKERKHREIVMSWKLFFVPHWFPFLKIAMTSQSPGTDAAEDFPSLRGIDARHQVLADGGVAWRSARRMDICFYRWYPLVN